MSEQRVVPEVRFAGFADPWEQRKLGDIAEKVLAKNLDGSITEVLTNSAERGVISQTDYFDHAVAKENSITAYYVVEPGDFVYNPRISVAAPVGPIRRNTLGRCGVMSPLYTVFRLRGGVDGGYLGHFFKTDGWHAFMKLEGNSGARSDRFSIGDETFFEMPILMPSVIEQHAIGAFFSRLDDLITLHQRKHDKLVVLKKTMLEKMFPKEGESVPEVRFAGFTDPWEQRKLGECGVTYSGLSGKTKEDFGHGDALFIPYTNVFDNPISDVNRLEAVEIDSRQNEVRQGDVLFTVSSETPEEVGMSSVWPANKPNVYLNSFCFGYRQDGTFDSDYLAYMLRSVCVRDQLTLLAQGISRFNISKNKVMELSVPAPSTDEQQTIGRFFSRFDSLITLHQRKLELLKNIKQSMLDKMFV